MAKQLHKTQWITILLILIFVALVAGWYGQRVFLQHQQQVALDAMKLVEDFDVTIIDTIHIDSVADTELVREGDTWYVASLPQRPPANASAINALLSMIDAASIQSTVSTTDSDLHNFGDDVSAVYTVTGLHEGSEVFTVHFGGSGTIPLTVYAKRSDDSTVYLVNGSAATVAVNDWRIVEENTFIEEEAGVQSPSL